jgi:hypothetical protein
MAAWVDCLLDPSLHFIDGFPGVLSCSSSSQYDGLSSALHSEYHQSILSGHPTERLVRYNTHTLACVTSYVSLRKSHPNSKMLYEDMHAEFEIGNPRSDLSALNLDDIDKTYLLEFQFVSVHLSLRITCETQITRSNYSFSF